MNELDKMMECLGFDGESVKNYGSAMPFTSRKLDIMGRIHEAAEAAPRSPDFYALFYILSIAFSVLVMRFFVLVEAKDTFLFSIFTSLVVNYSDQLQDGFKAISLLLSVLICAGTGVMILHLKNQKHFC